MIPYFLYFGLITIASVGISGVTALIFEIDFLSGFGYTWIAIIAVVLLDGLTATVCRLLPAKFADHEKKFFQVSAKEKKFYEKLKIRKWKDLIPEIGQFTGFRKNKLVDPKSVAYLDRFLLECCYGQIGHISSLFSGFLILFLFPIADFWFAIAIPVAIVNAFMNLPSLFILRYNAYKLNILRKSTIKKQERTKSKVNE